MVGACRVNSHLISELFICSSIFRIFCMKGASMMIPYRKDFLSYMMETGDTDEEMVSISYHALSHLLA